MQWNITFIKPLRLHYSMCHTKKQIMGYLSEDNVDTFSFETKEHGNCLVIFGCIITTQMYL